MKKVLCVLAMFLLIVSAKAQNAFDYYTFNNDKGEIVINMENVLNPDLRFCMLSAIVNDSNLSYIIDDSEENSRLILSSNNLSFNEFKDYFSNIESKI